jgi:catechol 1,2-dioxygenase
MADRRTVELFDEFMDLVRGFVVKHDLGYPEYEAVRKYLISVGEAGEWPLWMDAFLESTVNTTSYGVGTWTPSAITGPYYKENAPLLTEKPYELPMRPDEPGEPLLFRGKVTGPDGAPVGRALIDVWHSTNDGVYTFFDPALPDEYLLRGRFYSDNDGSFEFRSILPVPYQIPSNGPTGYLMETVLGRHSWRPAHLHWTITASGFTPLTTQLYFEGDPYLDSDSCSAVKNDLVISPTSGEHDGTPVTLAGFDFVLQPVAERVTA